MLRRVILRAFSETFHPHAMSHLNIPTFSSFCSTPVTGIRLTQCATSPRSGPCAIWPIPLLAESPLRLHLVKDLARYTFGNEVLTHVLETYDPEGKHYSFLSDRVHRHTVPRLPGGLRPYASAQPSFRQAGWSDGLARLRQVRPRNTQL